MLDQKAIVIHKRRCLELIDQVEAAFLGGNPPDHLEMDGPGIYAEVLALAENETEQVWLSYAASLLLDSIRQNVQDHLDIHAQLQGLTRQTRSNHPQA